MISSTQRTRRSPIEMVPKADLTSERLAFRPLGYADEGAFLEALERSRNDLRRWFPLEHKGESSQAYFQRMVELGIDGDKKGTSWRRGVFTDSGAFVGVANLIKIDRGLDWCAEMNLWVDKAFQGKGFGREIIQSVTDHALGDIPVGLGLHTLKAFVCLDNAPSKHLFGSLGFECRGVTEMLRVNQALIRHHELVRRAV